MESLHQSGKIQTQHVEFSYHLWELPPFPPWLKASISSTIHGKDTIVQETIHMSMSPMLKAK